MRLATTCSRVAWPATSAELGLSDNAGISPLIVSAEAAEAAEREAAAERIENSVIFMID
jgi:hypothetical protein